MADEAQKPPIEQLVDLFVYAPIGLLYEYPDVMDKIVKRGRSQTQLAKVMAQMAARQGASGAQQGVDAAVTDLAAALARCITEVGQRVGLAPDDVAEAAPGEAAPAEAAPGEGAAPEPEAAAAATPAAASEAAVPDADTLPIAGYAELKAREIVGLLSELDPDELETIRAFEAANRHRKTVLAKIDGLLAE